MKTTYENILGIIGLIVVVGFAITCAYVFHDSSSKYCTGDNCVRDNMGYSVSYKKLKHYNVELFTSFNDFQNRTNDDEVLSNDVELDEGDFRKNNVIVVTIPKQECGTFRIARFNIENGKAVGLLERRNKSKCFSTTRHFFAKINKDTKIKENNIELYFMELNSNYQ